MGKKSPSVPPPPDPVATANAQAAANKDAMVESARTNAVNLYGPQGSVTYGQYDERGVPKAQYTNLTPAGQRLYDSQQAISQLGTNAAFAKMLQVPMDGLDMGSLPYSPSGYNTAALPTFNPMSTPQGAPAYYGGFPNPTGRGVFGPQGGGGGFGGGGAQGGWQQPQPPQQSQAPNILDGVMYPGSEAYNQKLGSWDMQTSARAQLNEYEQAQFAARDAYNNEYDRRYKQMNQGRKASKPPLIPQMDDFVAPLFQGTAPQDFNADAYMAANPHIADTGASPWEHYVRFGRINGLNLYNAPQPQSGIPTGYVPTQQPAQPQQDPMAALMAAARAQRDEYNALVAQAQAAYGGNGNG